MTNSPAVQLTPHDAEAAQLTELERQLAQREDDLAARKLELQRLQSRYLTEISGLYAELTVVQAEVTATEIRAGLKPASIIEVEATAQPGAASEDGAASASGCAQGSAPSDGLKRVFRDLAKAIHPDLAGDEPARCHRHSLMAEANRAYAELDEDRLRLILRAWEQSPEAVVGDDPEAMRQRAQRRAAQVRERLVAIEAEFADLHGSAIDRLRVRVDLAAAQGWDLFAEMILQVKREITRATRRLEFLQRTRPGAAGA